MQRPRYEMTSRTKSNRSHRVLQRAKSMWVAELLNTTLTSYRMGLSMLDASQSINSGPIRPLRGEERNLIRSLLSGIAHSPGLADALDDARAVDMNDGGMGSIRFVQAERRVFGRTLAEAEYTD